MSTVIDRTPKSGETLTVEDKKYIVLREKGALLYVCPEKGEQVINLYFTKEKTIVPTKVPVEVFRIGGRKRELYPKEIQVLEGKVFIFGEEFSRVGKPNYVADCLNIHVRHGETSIIVTVKFASFTLQSASAA